MEKSEIKTEINIFEKNRELKQEIVGLKNEIANLREENLDLKEQIEKISVTSTNKNPPSAGKIEKSAPENNESPKMPAWLPDVLDWIKRAELAQSSLSIASWAFNQYCWRKLHGKVKSRIVRKLTFSREWDEEANARAKLKVKGNDAFIPIACTNPPEYIAGFRKIKFRYVDGQVLKFIRSIFPLLNEIIIKFADSDDNIGPISHLMALIAPKIHKLDFYYSDYYFSDFVRQFPYVLDKIQAISLFPCRSKSDWNILAKWLSKPRDDGKPKILNASLSFQSDVNTVFDRIEKEFVDLMEPANFIIFFESGYFYYPIFIMENEKTDEILELYKKRDSNNETMHFLVRHRKGGEAQRANWEEEFNRNSNKTKSILMP